ncbi:MAG: hypothetical protein AAFQ82_11775 [Myxococcota bacterium]
MNRLTRGWLVGVGLGLCACGSTSSSYTRQLAADSELSLFYRDKLYVYQGAEVIEDGPTFTALPKVTSCVPKAHTHAVRARRSGRVSRVLRVIGATAGVASLGGLAGLAQDDRDTALTYIGVGAGVALTGLIFASVAHSTEIQAQGNAVDSVNYWNDAMGFDGGRCP